jgi:hypothetical protein
MKKLVKKKWVGSCHHAAKLMTCNMWMSCKPLWRYDKMKHVKHSNTKRRNMIRETRSSNDRERVCHSCVCADY